MKKSVFFWRGSLYLCTFLYLICCFFPRRHLRAGSLSLRPTGTASPSTTSASIRRTACSGRSSARTPRTATPSAAPRSWATAAAIRASPSSAPACWQSSTRFPSKEQISTSPWTWRAKRCPSLWCDGGREQRSDEQGDRAQQQTGIMFIRVQNTRVWLMNEQTCRNLQPLPRVKGNKRDL